MTTIAGFSPEVARELLAFYRQAKASGLLRPQSNVPAVLPQAVPLYVKNVSGEAIPAYACMQATGTEEVGGQNYLQVDKPADAVGTAGGYLFNGPRSIEIGGNGVGSAGPVARALGAGATATAGAKWSPAANAWTVAPTSGGLFTMVGNDDVSTNVVRVFVATGGSSTCTPTTYITALQDTGSAIQYKSYDTATCTESAWTNLVTFESCTT